MPATLKRRSVLALGAGAAGAGLIGPPSGRAEAKPRRGRKGESKSNRYRWDRVAVGGGGAVPTLLMHPHVQGLMYLRTDVGTVYRWDPANERWIPLLEWVPESEWWFSAADSIAIDPSEKAGKTLYISVGRYDWAGRGDVWKSTDRGETWTRTGLRLRMTASTSQRYENRLAVDPENGDVIYYASTWDGLWRSLDGARTWQRISPTLNDGRFVAFGKRGTTPGPKPRSRLVYVGLRDEIYRSTDGGQTWDSIRGRRSAPGNRRCRGRAVGYSRSRPGPLGREAVERVRPHPRGVQRLRDRPDGSETHARRPPCKRPPPGHLPVHGRWPQLAEDQQSQERAFGLGTRLALCIVDLFVGLQSFQSERGLVHRLVLRLAYQ